MQPLKFENGQDLATVVGKLGMFTAIDNQLKQKSEINTEFGLYIIWYFIIHNIALH